MKNGPWLRKAIAGSLWFAMLLVGLVWFLWEPLPRFAEVQRNFKPSDAWIVDRDHNPLEAIRTHQDRRSLEWLPLSEVSPVWLETLIQVEDQRFHFHHGVDYVALLKAGLQNLSNSGRRGASTLSMQLVGLLQGPARSSIWLKKFEQILLAWKLESQWSKEEILEAYLNLVAFRGELVGLKAASLGYFNKSPRALNSLESALLIALIRSPNATPEKVGTRACRILESDDCTLVQAEAQRIFSQNYHLPRAREKVPVLSEKIVESGWKSSVIQTSLRADVQEAALLILKEQLKELKNKNVKDGAVLVIETKTGRVAAYVANGGAGFSSASQIDGIQMRRQAGSTIKPFVYATAFEEKYLQAGSLIEDSPADIPVGQGRVYHPKNYDNTFRGNVSAAEALASSLNVPAVRALNMVGEDAVIENLKKLKFTELQDEDFYGPSLALGTIDVSLWELTEGYRQLALESSVDSKVFSEETREMLFQILAAPEYRRLTFGLDSILSLPFLAAVKTGTSKDMRDNWCIGWTSEYTVGVWVGNFDGQPMWNVSGVTGAAPIWNRLMLALHPNPPKSPEIQFEKPAEPLQKKSLTRIHYPVEDMFVGVDPDIPARLQKLPIEIENAKKGQSVFINNLFLGRAESRIFWKPQRGKFTVELRDENQKVVDAVSFQVR